MSKLETSTLDVRGVAAVVGCSTKTVYRAIASGELEACRLGPRGRYRITPAALDAWLHSTTEPPRVPALSRAETVQLLVETDPETMRRDVETSPGRWTLAARELTAEERAAYEAATPEVAQDALAIFAASRELLLARQQQILDRQEELLEEFRAMRATTTNPRNEDR